MRCPVCGSRKVTKLKTGSFRCEDCGFIFYPDREAIIDMRDLLPSDEIDEETVVEIGEDIRVATEESMGELYSENIKNIFKPGATLEDIGNKYDAEEYVYGTFADMQGEISGTLILIIPERGLREIVKRYGSGIVGSLKKLTREYFNRMCAIFECNSELTSIDVVHDTMLSIMNYIISERGKEHEMMMMSYEFMSATMEHYGDMLFLPTKNSLRSLRR